ncbi:pyridoxamine 5'-phosphate oxidase family protein [Aestuariispira ectoiniformans]|uniref:pyridoxamine 5'-phosphate oxidase family protein n=1 Tax=Aestuariispira ectoiniformans TaxID=2775080 RepID=UPI00223B2CB6|nr:pyridoxamine 5'-phosphate oxidase family protein [Aestuariispira ectoiniformans]
MNDITTLDQLREMYPQPTGVVELKSLTKLEKHCRNFISQSPFLVIATGDVDGRQDASPKGDAPGFVRVVDDNTILIPDRIGNNRADSLVNILSNPHVGVIFFIPGIGETLRVNGRASLVADPALLESFTVQGKQPKLIIRVQVEEAYLHCAKAIIRSKLWQDDNKIDRKDFPTLGRMVADQIESMKIDADEADARLEESYRDRLY